MITYKTSDFQIYKKMLYWIIVSLILTPSIRIGIGMAFRIEELITVVFFLYIFLKLALQKKALIIVSIQQALIILSMLMIPISIFMGVLIGHDASLGDLFQLVRWTKYLLIYVIVISVIGLSSEPQMEKEKIIQKIMNSSIILFLISLQQYFNIFNLNQRYIPYIAPTQMRSLLAGYAHPRPVGMVGNPNELGFIFAMIALVALFLLIYRGIRMKVTMVLIINITGLIITLSRTALIAFLAGAVILVLRSLYIRGRGFNIKRLRSVLLIGFLLSTIAVTALDSEKLFNQFFWRFYKILDISSDTSWSSRFYSWSNNIELFSSSPLLGVGPLRRTAEVFGADNEWLLLLRSYGILGVLFLVFTFGYPIFKCKDSQYFYLAVSLLVSAGLFMVPAAVFHSLTIMPLLIIILALSHEKYEKYLVKF